MRQKRRSFLKTCGTLGTAAGCNTLISGCNLSAGGSESGFDSRLSSIKLERL